LAALHEQTQAEGQDQPGERSAELHQEPAKGAHKQDAKPDFRDPLPQLWLF